MIWISVSPLLLLVPFITICVCTQKSKGDRKRAKLCRHVLRHCCKMATNRHQHNSSRWFFRQLQHHLQTIFGAGLCTGAAMEIVQRGTRTSDQPATNSRRAMKINRSQVSAGQNVNVRNKLHSQIESYQKIISAYAFLNRKLNLSTATKSFPRNRNPFWANFMLYRINHQRL